LIATFVLRCISLNGYEMSSPRLNNDARVRPLEDGNVASGWGILIAIKGILIAIKHSAIIGLAPVQKLERRRSFWSLRQCQRSRVRRLH
jgi:hypothetical protein